MIVDFLIVLGIWVEVVLAGAVLIVTLRHYALAKEQAEAEIRIPLLKPFKDKR